MLNRRHFLKQSTLLALAPTVPSFLAQTANSAESRADDRVLVVIQLDGGNDGVNTVVPYSDQGYEKNRSELRLANDRLIKLNDDIALHPSLEDMHKLWESDRLAIVNGVGYPNPNRSHDVSMAIWQTCSFDRTEHNGYGWLGRALDSSSAPKTSSPSAVLVGDGKPPVALRSRRSIAANVDRIDELLLPGDVRRTEQHAAAAATEDLSAFVERSTLDAYNTADQLSKLGKPDQAATRSPRSELERRLQLVSQLIKADFQTRVFYTVQSGYDTHSVQLPRHERLLRDLSRSLFAFFEDLRAAKLDERVVVLCFSEFGRRVKENASIGTDHGTAGPVLLAGPSVAPGLHGEMPSLLDLENDDLKHTVDFRQVYASVLQQWLGLTDERIRSGGHQPLDLLRRA